MIRKMLCLLVVLLLAVPLSYAGQSASKLSKMADKAATKGDYYSAAVSYLDSLAKKPKSTKTRQKLAEVALPAYDQKLKLAENYRNSGNLEGALREFNELRQFVDKLRIYNAVNFMTIDFTNTVSAVSEGAAETRYKNAENYFAGQSYDRAIEEFKAALVLKSPYKDSFEKISESYYRIATGHENSGAYRKAAEVYMQSCRTMPNYKDAKAKAVLIYYSLGNYFLNAGHYRKAYEDLSFASAIDPRFSDLPAKLGQAKDLGTIRVAFVRFDNTTGQNVAGMDLGDIILENIKSKTQAGASQFVRTVDRDELLTIAREQRIAEGQFDFEMNKPLKISGVDYLIMGKLNQVRSLHQGPRVERVAGTFDFWREVPYTTKDGKQKTRSELSTANMTYDLFTDRISLNLGGAIKVIETKTGVIAITHPIAENGGDEIAYADNFRPPQVLSREGVELDEQVVKLIEGRRELVDIGEIANRMIAAIADAMANAILAALDKATYVSDPATLKY